MSQSKDNRAVWERLFAEVHALEYEPSNFDAMLHAAKVKYFEDEQALGLTGVEYDFNTYKLIFHLVDYKVNDFHTIKGQTVIDSRIIQGFKSEWELQGLCLYFPDTEFVHEIKYLFQGHYGTKKWMEMLNLLKHKGFQGVATESDEGYFGNVLLPEDVVTFQGATLNQAFEAFVDSVDDYLEFKA